MIILSSSLETGDPETCCCSLPRGGYHITLSLKREQSFMIEEHRTKSKSEKQAGKNPRRGAGPFSPSNRVDSTP